MLTTINVTLAKANKCLNKIKTLAKSYDDSKLYFTYLPKNSDDYQTLLNDELTVFNKKLEIFKEIRDMKDIVYSKNTELGIDKILSSIQILENEKKVYQQYLKSTKSFGSFESPDTKDKLDLEYKKLVEDEEKKLQSSNNYYPTNILNKEYIVGIFSYKDIETKIKTISKQVEQLEGDRDKLNNLNYVNLTFSKETCEQLGLN